MITGPVTTLPQAIEWLRAEAPRLSADEIERLAKTAIEYADQLPVVVGRFLQNYSRDLAHGDATLQQQYEQWARDWYATSAPGSKFAFGFDTRAMQELVECLPGTLHDIATEPKQ